MMNFDCGVTAGPVVSVNDHIQSNFPHSFQRIFPDLITFWFTGYYKAFADMFFNKFKHHFQFREKITPDGQVIPDNCFTVKSTYINGGD